MRYTKCRRRAFLSLVRGQYQPRATGFDRLARASASRRRRCLFTGSRAQQGSNTRQFFQEPLRRLRVFSHCDCAFENDWTGLVVLVADTGVLTDGERRWTVHSGEGKGKACLTRAATYPENVWPACKYQRVNAAGAKRYGEHDSSPERERAQVAFQSACNPRKICGQSQQANTCLRTRLRQRSQGGR